MCIKYSGNKKVKTIKIIAENIKIGGVNVSNEWYKCYF